MRQDDNTPVFSTNIQGCIEMFERAQQDYEWNLGEVNRLDKLTQDYLHMLELNNLDYKQRAKVATQLMKCRQMRRESKDTTEILKPLIDFINTDKGKNMRNLMKEALGKTRKTEEYMKSRSYRYKVLSEDAGG